MMTKELLLRLLKMSAEEYCTTFRGPHGIHHTAGFPLVIFFIMSHSQRALFTRQTRDQYTVFAYSIKNKVEAGVNWTTLWLTSCNILLYCVMRLSVRLFVVLTQVLNIHMWYRCTDVQFLCTLPKWNSGGHLLFALSVCGINSNLGHSFWIVREFISGK